MSTTIVRTFFENKLLTWANSKNPQVGVALQNFSFTKPSPKKIFVEGFLLPNRNINRNISGTQYTMLGLFQVNVWGPKGEMMVGIENMAEEIKALFPVVPKGVVSIEQTPTVGRPLDDPSGWTGVAVEIFYRYEV